MTELHLIAMANLALCLASAFICLCRLNGMGDDTRRLVVFEYAFGMGALLFSAGRPLIGEWPGYASLAMGAFVLFQLLASAPAWKGDTPPDVATDHAPLGDEPYDPR